MSAEKIVYAVAYRRGLYPRSIGIDDAALGRVRAMTEHEAITAAKKLNEHARLVEENAALREREQRLVDALRISQTVMREWDFQSSQAAMAANETLLAEVEKAPCP